MSSSERATAARMSADPVALEARLSVAALFDVLDRQAVGSVPAHTGSVSVRTPARRPASYRPAGARGGAVRTVPLRSVRPAPMARPVPGTSLATAVPVALAPTAAPGRLLGLVRRAALWGAGPQGEYLAWRPAVGMPGRSPDRAVVSTSPTVPPAARRTGLLRRISLWGAGVDGEYLAWGGPPRPAPKPAADRPVVLREMPSTPTIGPPTGRTPRVQIPTVQPAAPSPAAVLSPHGPASTGPRWMPPIPRGAVAVPGVRPSGRPERSRATGWPSQDPGAGVPTGLARARGDPLSSPARGSPVPARRSRSPNSSRSSFP
jgi:hypothetical protein